MRAIVTVLGKDRVGIMSAVCTLLAEHNVNVLDISQTILQGYFTMVMLVDVSAGDMPFADLAGLLEQEGKATTCPSTHRERIFLTPCTGSEGCCRPSACKRQDL